MLIIRESRMMRCMKFRALIQILAIIVLATLLAACPSQKQDYVSRPNWHLSDFVPFVHSSSLWAEMDSNFKLTNHPPQMMTVWSLHWFTTRKRYISELTHNAQPYLYYVYKETQKRGMPAEIALIPMIESNYNPFVYSHRGATGLWQMMPGTASGNGLHIDWWYDGRRDIIASTKAALDYMEYLHKRFNGDWLLAMAAYDSGEGTVRNAIKRNKRLHKPTDFWSLKLPKETRNYVPKILALANIIKSPSRYNVKLEPIPNSPFFATTMMSGQIDLNEVAKLAQTKLSNIRLLNPGFRRWATAPNHNYTLLLPKRKIEIFAKNFNSSPNLKVTWMHHKVEAGQSLSLLAQKFNTKTNIIKRVNNMKNDNLRVGQHLLIPLAMQTMAGHITLTTTKTNYRIAEDKVPGPKRYLHTVAPHETLWSISARYGLTPAKIRYWNGLSYHAKLRSNQKLVLWLPHHFVNKTIKYHVRSGDSLSVIAERFSTSVDSLKQWNSLADDEPIRIGQMLHIYKR